MKRYIRAAEEIDIDIEQFKPSPAIIKKIMDYRAKGSRVNVKAIKDINKLLTYYYTGCLIGWQDLCDDIYYANYQAHPYMFLIEKAVKADPQFADKRSFDDIVLGLSDSHNLFTFDERRQFGKVSCWLPKSILQFFIDEEIPVHFGKRTPGGRYDHNGRQWSEIEHLTLFPGTDLECNYDIIVHTDEGNSNDRQYTGSNTGERVSAKAVIDDLKRFLDMNGITRYDGMRFISSSTSINSSTEVNNVCPDWILGLYWDVDGHTFEVTEVDTNKNVCEITETWISEDTWEDCSRKRLYNITRSGEDFFLVKQINPNFKFCVSAAFNYDSKCPDELNVYKKDDMDYGDEDDDLYTPSATRGDYSPSSPWNAPGMSIRDFI